MNKLNKIIQDIKSAGFGYIKVELEAELNRPDEYYDEGEYVDCVDCDSGELTCETCDGHGYTTISREDGTKTTETEEVECGDCAGSGYLACDECDGSGEIYIENESEADGLGDTENCKEFILDNISQEAKDALIFSHFYNDGSVDSEFTFTIPVEKIGVLPEFVDSFNKLAEAIGNGMDVDGAGMHIAVLPTESEGRYPVRSFNLDAEKLNNFRIEVTKLLPALFLAATSGNFTRELYFRMPKISDDKYSAIHVLRGCFEYRLFETCYQAPETIFEYLGTIAKTLEYYKDPTKKVASMGKEYPFYDREGIAGFTTTPEQVSILKKQLRMVLPDDITIKNFTQKRDIKLLVTEARKKHSKAISRAKVMYKEAMQSFEVAVARPLTDYEKETIADRDSYGYWATATTMKEKIGSIRGVRFPGDEETFIRNNLLDMRTASTVRV